MKHSISIFLIAVFALTAFAQTPKSPRNPVPFKNGGGNEKEAFDKAAALTDAAARIAALQKFVADFPKSKEINRALEIIVSGRAALADVKMQADDAEGGIALFKLAVGDAPAPVSDKLFSEILLQIPNSLVFRGQTAAAIEIAHLLEEKIAGNAEQTLALAGFYLGLENGGEAKRLAEKSIALQPNLKAAYQTLGFANRLDFQLEEAAAAYSKALELDTVSNISRRSLAEMQRALGKSDEAITLYREILVRDPNDAAAQTGLTLALFDAEKKAEAETEMQKSLAQNPNDLVLLVGAAYWYAAHNNSAKAVELAEQAVAIEPRYVWAHIALARGLVQQKRLPDAEKTLLVARNFGSFPTLDYEIAAVRLASGFYREAAEGLSKNFVVTDNGIETKLGGRVEKSAKSFVELLAPERRAAIFQPLAADNPEAAERLRTLLDFYQKLSVKDDAAVSAAADNFLKGADNAKLHRQIFVADQLLDKRRNLPKVLELTKAAVGGVDAALNVTNPAAAVLADELYESRRISMTRGELVIVPDVPRQTLSNILRGRIEEIAGWTLYQTGKPAESIVRLKRALSVLPEKSVWWRTAMWRLGAALDADGKPKDALEAYIVNYLTGEPDAAKRAVIETIYLKINGNLDGLDARIGAKPESFAANPPPSEIAAAPNENQMPPDAPTPAPTPETIKENVAEVPPPVENKIKTPTKIETKEPEKPVASNNAPKSIFEPIIITVPNTDAPKKPAENGGENRSRVVREQSPEPCKIYVSQESVSLLKDGGSLGLLVGFENAGDSGEITATSNGVRDIAVTVEPDIGNQTNRTFFIIKSISQKTGVFTVTFEAACGKREIQVKVR